MLKAFFVRVNKNFW